jgi:hypothetical protein
MDFADDGPEAVCEVSLNSGGVQGALGPAADFMIANPALVSGNVITLSEKAPKPKSQEAQGEGGCSANESWPFSGAPLAIAAMLLCVRLRRKRTLVNQNRHVDGLFGR